MLNLHHLFFARKYKLQHAHVIYVNCNGYMPMSRETPQQESRCYGFLSFFFFSTGNLTQDLTACQAGAHAAKLHPPSIPVPSARPLNYLVGLLLVHVYSHSFSNLPVTWAWTPNCQHIGITALGPAPPLWGAPLSPPLQDHHQSRKACSGAGPSSNHAEKETAHCNILQRNPLCCACIASADWGRQEPTYCHHTIGWGTSQCHNTARSRVQKETCFHILCVNMRK